MNNSQIYNELVNNKDYILIDVREPEEYSSGHASGAKNIPLQTINKDTAASLMLYKKVYVICKSGGRSAQAIKVLHAFSIPANDVPGGTIAWQNEGLPIEM